MRLANCTARLQLLMKERRSASSWKFTANGSVYHYSCCNEHCQDNPCERQGQGKRVIAAEVPEIGSSAVSPTAGRAYIALSASRRYRRRSQVVRQETANLSFVGSIPTGASQMPSRGHPVSHRVWASRCVSRCDPASTWTSATGRSMWIAPLCSGGRAADWEDHLTSRC